MGPALQNVPQDHLRASLINHFRLHAPERHRTPQDHLISSPQEPSERLPMRRGGVHNVEAVDGYRTDVRWSNMEQQW